MPGQNEVIFGVQISIIGVKVDKTTNNEPSHQAEPSRPALGDLTVQQESSVVDIDIDKGPSSDQPTTSGDQEDQEDQENQQDQEQQQQQSGWPNPSFQVTVMLRKRTSGHHHCAFYQPPARAEKTKKKNLWSKTLSSGR